MRFSNIPNNAKLELVKADKLRTESSTHIALQLPEGQRLQHAFSPSSSLWDIIEHWQQTLQRKLLADYSEDGQPMEPNLVYLTHNISGETKLKETKLRSIGLTGGKAVIRLSGRVIPADQQLTTAESPEKKKPKLETCSSESYMKKMDIVEGTENPSHSTDFHQEEMCDGEPEEHSKAVSADTFTDFNVEQNHLRPEQQKDTDANIEISETVKTTTSPEVDNRSKESKGSGAPVKESQQRPDVDVRMETTVETPVSEPQENLGPDVRRKETKSKEAPVREPLQNPRLHESPFADFKFPECVTDVESNSEMNIDESSEPQVCDREAVVFDLSGDNVPEMSNDTPDEFFEVTVDDVRKRLADLKHQSASDAPLQTSKMRENKERQKMLRYKKIVVRIVFPDKTVLQGFFRPQETVQALFEFVQTSLEEKSLEFYLYTSPPKTILKNRTETFFEATLFPAAKVYFGCKDKRSTWLSPSLLGSITPVAVVNKSLKSISETGFIETANKPSTSEGQSLERQEASTVAASKRPSPSATTNSQKIPKWFKLGKQ
ncbi:tether containing UBX domain for GLUT4-like [Anneissia japonica]|uniref:tether containing UBX domain for GLUT4-like n=1 Tax=Anneissia japonica TaxID=1529436 RepID=UPI001425652E|nr:tether containing UBX domain for GLUT4-like [Anneissia japonica]